MSIYNLKCKISFIFITNVFKFCSSNSWFSLVGCYKRRVSVGGGHPEADGIREARLCDGIYLVKSLGIIYKFRVDQLVAVEDLNGYRFGIQAGYQ